MKDLPPKIIPIPLEEQEFTVDITKMLPKELKKKTVYKGSNYKSKKKTISTCTGFCLYLT